MPRINDLSRWIFRRIKRIGDSAEFKIIMDAFRIKRMWYMADTVRISVYSRGGSKRVGVIIKHRKPDLIEFREFLSVVGAINYIESKYPRNSYIYYYTKPKKVA